MYSWPFYYLCKGPYFAITYAGTYFAVNRKCLLLFSLLKNSHILHRLYITQNLQVFGNAFEERKVNSLKWEALHVAVVQNKDPLFRSERLKVVVLLVVFIVNDGHVETVAFDDGEGVLLFLLFVFLFWVS